jgi:DNA polymerase-3 subunit delta
VGVDVVERGVADLAEEPIWELTDAIGEGRPGDALAVLAKLLGGGAPAPVVLGSLASHFRKLARVRAGGAVAAAPFVRRKLESQSRRYPPGRLRGALGAIHETDEALKGSGGIPAELALERLVIGLAS